MSETPRILVVEDDVSLASLLGDLLRLEGYDVAIAHDGEQALDRVAERRPDAIVLDIMLPGINGFEVCKRLKLKRETNLIPIIMLTALTDAESIRSGYRVGANRYLTKPFDAALLVEEIRHAVEHGKAVAQSRTHTSVDLQMQSDQRAREQLNDLLSELFVQTPLSEDQIEKIRYAVFEMIENAAEWGNKRRPELPVRITYELTDDYVKFIITDEGPGFDRSKLPHAANADDPTAHMEIREKLGLRHGGFGMLMARGMVDEVTYNDAGNQVTLTKFLRPQK